ncbi:MAG TPA: hypothetical protein VJ760_10375 [Nitrospiraceae bacterium]|nr:hypothetical protein [Nitrospiraceae bacterium]
MVGRVIFFVVLLIASGANAAERIMGLVEVPAVYGNIPRGAEGPVTLFAEPSIQAEVAAVVREWGHLEYRTVNAEQVAAVVYDYKITDGIWYKVRYSDGKKSMYAWLSGAATDQFSLYYQILSGRMTYFTAAWDKRVYQSPSVSAPFKQFDQFGEHTDVRVADVRNMGENLDPWFLVVILQKSNCAFGDEGTTIIATGWVPGYAESGSETIWHYAAGC